MGRYDNPGERVFKGTHRSIGRGTRTHRSINEASREASFDNAPAGSCLPLLLCVLAVVAAVIFGG